jgi:hypothetical protein
MQELSSVFIKPVGTPGLGYTLLLCLGKSLVVILNYTLTAEQPDPYGPEPYSPGKRPQTRSPLGEGFGDATCPGGGSPQPKQLGAPDLPGSTGPPPGPGPPYTIRTPQQGGTDTLPGAGPEPPRVHRCGHACGPRGFHWKTRLPTAFNAVGGTEPEAVCARFHC